MIELELAPHYEALADSDAQDYQRIADALGTLPLYHQWRTYTARTADIAVNSYNTGTGKTKSALLHLLDLDEAYRKDRYVHANVLFIAPTNELLRQHEEDVKDFVERNNLRYLVLRLDAATISALGREHLSEKFIRQGDRLHQMLQDPGSVLTDSDGQHIEGHRPYVLVINPDIFYYAFYGLGNPHDQKVLFRTFVEKFGYIIVDEFHYYNAKQLANFLFFLALSREWGYFTKGRKVCLLTATPVPQVKRYLDQLNLRIEYIEPGSERPEMRTTPTLAPVHLHLYSAEALENGLVSLASSNRSLVESWLDHGQHGAFISSALWRINALYQEYGGKANSSLGRLTGAEQSEWRAQHKLACLLMATPTVDIGYNFARPGKKRQNIDFLFFDSRSSDEFIQRLGRAGRVLGKEEHTIPSEVWAVVPDELVIELSKIAAGKTVTRSELNKMVNATLPPKNGIYAYISSGAIAEAFLPLYRVSKSLSSEEGERAEHLYKAILAVYDTRKPLPFKVMAWNIRRYLHMKALLPNLLREAKKKQFTFGAASVIARTLDEQHDVVLEDLTSIDEAYAQMVEHTLQKNQGAWKAEVKRRKEIEEYYVTEARFNFRDNFQPPLALAHDPGCLLATAEYTTYSALHIAQNYIADWFDTEQPCEAGMEKAIARLDARPDVCCEIRAPREQRLKIYFKLSASEQTRKAWEERYCSILAATCGFKLLSDEVPVPGQLNRSFEQNYITFYAVPVVGPEALALGRLQKNTSLFANILKVDFGNEGEHEYLIVVGSAALLVSYERSIMNAKYLVRRVSTRGSHIFDWDEEG